MSPTEAPLLRARFDPRLQTYFMLQVLLGLAATIVGAPLIPLWLLFGRGVHRRQFESLACELTARSIDVRRGYLFKVRQTIPLDKITDLAVYEGPLLRALGLCSMRVETAGGGQAVADGHAFLPGIVNLDEFRACVLAERDAAVLGAPRDSLPGEGARAAREHAPEDGSVLREIRDTLLRLERSLEARSSR